MDSSGACNKNTAKVLHKTLLIYLFLKIQEKTEKIVNSLDEENMELIKQFDKLSLTLRLWKMSTISCPGNNCQLSNNQPQPKPTECNITMTGLNYGIVLLNPERAQSSAFQPQQLRVESKLKNFQTLSGGIRHKVNKKYLITRYWNWVVSEEKSFITIITILLYFAISCCFQISYWWFAIFRPDFLPTFALQRYLYQFIIRSWNWQLPKL